jgi:hypothetical protein
VIGSRLVLAALVGLMLTLAGVTDSPPPRPPAPPADAPDFPELMKRVAKEYLAYGRVDDEMRWAPWLCRMPLPGLARFSASGDDATHGCKLYSLFARDHPGYLKVAQTRAAAVGQVLVKQSWAPVEVAASDRTADRGAVDYAKVIHTPPPPGGPKSSFNPGDHFYPYARQGDKLFKADRLAGLFIMAKLDPATPGTDAGWVYGTVTADGKTVTAAGRVESCLKCHQEAPHDRLFGLPGR